MTLVKDQSQTCVSISPVMFMHKAESIFVMLKEKTRLATESLLLVNSESVNANIKATKTFLESLNKQICGGNNLSKWIRPSYSRCRYLRGLSELRRPVNARF